MLDTFCQVGIAVFWKLLCYRATLCVSVVFAIRLVSVCLSVCPSLTFVHWVSCVVLSKECGEI